jgi:hypothetical protein
MKSDEQFLTKHKQISYYPIDGNGSGETKSYDKNHDGHYVSHLF